MYEFKDEKGDVLRLLGLRVLVEMEMIKEKTKSNIIIPETSRDVMQGKVDCGKLICISEEVGEAELPLKIGDTIYIQRYAGIELTIDDKLYKIVKTEDIYASITRGKNDKID